MRTKKALYNIASQMSYEIIAMICGLILPRFILSAFGSNYNGIISSITQFLDYISILTLGVSGATRVAIYKAQANGGIKEVSAVLKATDLYMKKVACAFVGYLICLMVIYPLLFRAEFEIFEIASLVAVIGIGTFAEYFFGITFRTYLMANQCMYISNLIQIITKVASTLISVVLILQGHSILVVKIGSAVCFAGAPVALYFIVKKKFGILTDVDPDATALKQRNDVMAHSIANCVHQYTDIFLLTLFTTPKIVSVYSVYGLVLSSLRKLQSVFTSGLEGAFGELWANEEYEKFEHNFNTFEYLIFSFVSVVFSCALILLLPFIVLYTKGINDAEYTLPTFAFVSILADVFFCLRAPYLITVQAAGMYRETKKYAFIEAGLNFAISTVAVFQFGLVGVVLGTLVANLYRTVQYALFSTKHLFRGRSISVFLKRLLWLFCNMSMIYIFKIILPSISINDWQGWIFAGFYYCFIAISVTLGSSYIFYRSDFVDSIKIIKRMLQKKRIVRG